MIILRLLTRINIPVTYLVTFYLGISYLSYLSHLLSCIFYHSDDVTCSNETLGLKILKMISCYGFVQSYLPGNYISDQNSSF